MYTVADVESAYARMDALLTEQEEILATLDAEAQNLARAERVQARIDAQRAAAAAAASIGLERSHRRWHPEVVPGALPGSRCHLSRACRGRSSPPSVRSRVDMARTPGHRRQEPWVRCSSCRAPSPPTPSTVTVTASPTSGTPRTPSTAPRNYLCANGAAAVREALYGAIYRYNHADWYVLMVMRVAGAAGGALRRTGAAGRSSVGQPGVGRPARQPGVDQLGVGGLRNAWPS